MPAIRIQSGAAIACGAAVVDAIVELNGLDSVDLLPGAELELP